MQPHVPPHTTRTLDTHTQTYSGAIFQEGPDGDSLAAITTREQLDILMKALNPRGPREAALLGVLRRRYDELAEGLDSLSIPLDITQVGLFVLFVCVEDRARVAR